MALVICRRLPGSVCGTPPCLALTTHHVSKTCVLAAPVACALTVSKPAGCPAFCNSFPNATTHSVASWSVGSCTQHRGQHPSEHSSICRPARRVGSVSSTSSPRGILTANCSLLQPGFSRAAASKTSAPVPGPTVAAPAEEEATEVFDSFEDPRVFLKLRPEYQIHSYHRPEACQTLPASEGELILHKVTVYQDSLQPPSIASCFCQLSSLPAEQHPILLSSANFALLCQLSVKKVELFDTQELIGILKALVTLRIPASHSMLDVYEAKFCHKVWDMSLDQLLLVADLWRNLGRRVPRFLEIFFSYLNLHWKDLSLSQLIHLIYIIGESRQAPPDLMQKLESLVLRYIDLINSEEVGTVCLGFFKSSSRLSEFAMRRIGDVACAGMQHLRSYALVNVLKMFRFTHVDHVEFMRRFGQVAPQRIPSLGVQGVMHLTLACSSLRVLDEGVLNAVAASLPSRVEYCRSKDIAKILWSFGTLNYKPPNAEEFYSSLISEVHRKLPEFSRYPEHLPTCLLGLAFSEYFPEELIDFALSPKFIQLAQERTKFELLKELCTLDGVVGVECPGYRGNRLSPGLRQEGLAVLWDLARKDMMAKPEFLEALALLESMLGGPQYVRHHMILPHSRSSDLEVQLDIDMKPLPFNEEAAPAGSLAGLKLRHMGVHLTDDLMSRLVNGKLESGELLRGEAEDEAGRQPRESEKAAVPPRRDTADRPGTSQRAPRVKLALQLTNRNQYCYGTRHILGLHGMKRRQLARLGYHVVELAYWEWLPLLPRTRLEKLAFLHDKVFSSAL